MPAMKKLCTALGLHALLLFACMAASTSQPLRIHPTNPRYFTDGTTNADGSLKAIYMGGHEIFVDQQDNAFNKEWTKDLSNPEDPKAQARLLNGYALSSVWTFMHSVTFYLYGLLAFEDASPLLANSRSHSQPWFSVRNCHL